MYFVWQPSFYYRHVISCDRCGSTTFCFAIIECSFDHIIFRNSHVYTIIIYILMALCVAYRRHSRVYQLNSYPAR